MCLVSYTAIAVDEPKNYLAMVPSRGMERALALYYSQVKLRVEVEEEEEAAAATAAMTTSALLHMA